MLKNEQKTPEYEEINPNKTVPALTHGDIKADFQIFHLFLIGPLIGPSDWLKRIRINLKTHISSVNQELLQCTLSILSDQKIVFMVPKISN